MSRAKTERLLNLVICLLATRRYLSREEIRRSVPGYAERYPSRDAATDAAFERAFERDKDELREMGVPVETGSNSAWFDDEVGYRIRRDAYALPEVAFAPDEMAVLALAARTWQQATLAGAASSALLKLQAYGVRPEDLDLDLDARVGFAGLDPRVDTNEAAFLPLWRALDARYPVRFSYRRPGGATATQRTVEPWGLVAWRGRWYLVGHDRDRADTRVFRVSRIAGDITAAGAPGEVTVPDDVDVRREVAHFTATVPRSTARVRVRAGAGGLLRRQAAVEERASAGDVDGADDDGWDLLQVPFADPEGLADALAGLGADAVVLDPPEVRDAVVRRLQAAAGPVADGGPRPSHDQREGGRRRVGSP